MGAGRGGLDPRTPSNEDYRGPYANSEPENAAYDRLLRRIKPIANLNYHSAAQLLNSSFGFITNRPADDNTLARSLTGTDGDAAVDPYQPDQASDLYVTHGETVDWAYFQFGTIGFTPELDTAQTAGSSANSFVFPDDEAKVNAVFEKNLPLALNLAWSATGDDFDRPSNFFDDARPLQGQGDARHRADRVRRLLRRRPDRRGRRAPLARPDRLPGLGLRPRRHATRRCTCARRSYTGGERYGDVPGKYFGRERATRARVVPAHSTTGTGATPRPVIAGDTVTVTVRAGGQEQVFSYKVVVDPAGRRRRSASSSSPPRTTPARRRTRRRTRPPRATSRSTSTR